MAGEAKRLELRAVLSGPFFENQPSKTFRQNVRAMLDALAEEAEKDIRSQISGKAGSMPAYTGATYDRVIGRTSSLTGRRWALSAVVSVNTDGMDRVRAIRHKASGASIERRWHPFRRTATAMRASRAVISANLTAGLE